MPNYTNQFKTERQINAISELCYEVGVSVNMHYDGAQSSASTGDAVKAFKTYFKYDKDTKIVHRNDYVDEKQWINLLKEQIDLSSPCVYIMSGEIGAHAPCS